MAVRANRLSSESSRLALYDKRYGLFSATKDFIRYMFTDDTDETRQREEFRKMNEALVEARFLLPTNIQNQLEGIYLAASELRRTDLKIKHPSSAGSPKWKALFEAQSKNESYLWDALGKLEELFHDCLDFTDLKKLST